MRLLWVWLCSLLPRLTLCAAQRCAVHEINSSSNVSSLLESLQCQNDYESYVHCSWRGDGNVTLWLQGDAKRELCQPWQPPGQHGTTQCRILTDTWAIGIRHRFFFLKNETPAVCASPALRPVHLSHHLRARPPVNLSTCDDGNGRRVIRWSCPYAPASSLATCLSYQLSYRPDTQDNWTTEKVTDTNITLNETRLLPGHRYEAKVRMQASVGQWSRWSPVVTWQTQDDAAQPPSLHCELDGDREVTCSWEMSGDLAHFISYQLTCRQNQIGLSERCCANPTVRPELSGTVLRYSCSLTVADPAHLLLELQPTHNAKTFNPTEHISPKPPQKVKVKEQGYNWIVEWAKPSTPLDLCYQLCYCRTPQQEPCTCLNTSALHQIIPGARLVPSQAYEVRLRSLVVPGEGSRYKGIPSEWTDAERWTSHPANYVVYVLIGAFVAVLFLVCYCAFPACRRRLVLWVDSVPSPRKSKILSEIKAATGQSLMQSEDTSICKVLHSDTVSTCSSNASLWLMKETNKAVVELDEGVWNCHKLSSLAEKQSSDTSSMSFSGPYIFCQTKDVQTSAGGKCEEEAGEDKASADSLSPGGFALFGEGYVRLPSRAVSRSTQDLISYSNDAPDASVQPEAASRDQPPAYTTAPFSPCPQGGHTQASGYCFLPQPS